VLDLQSEGDVIGVLNSYAARQDDRDTFRLWEVAGTSHADRHLLGTIADQLDCGAPINDGPLHLVAKAALRALVAWVDDGTAPPKAERLGIVEGDEPKVERDANGIAVGGIRTPPVDVPVRVLSGAPGPSDALICILMGSTLPLPSGPPRVGPTGREAYLDDYGRAADAAIDAGWVLAEDRDALMGFARPELAT
jgi:hypothetical protein